MPSVEQRADDLAHGREAALRDVDDQVGDRLARRDQAADNRVATSTAASATYAIRSTIDSPIAAAACATRRMKSAPAATDLVQDRFQRAAEVASASCTICCRSWSGRVRAVTQDLADGLAQREGRRRRS